MRDEINEFKQVMGNHGLHAGLEYLNSRTPHRYTGVFRFDGEILRNEALFDRLQPAVQQADGVPLAMTYCSLVGQLRAPLEIADAPTDPRVRGLIETPVISYCGVLVRDEQGQPYGTLCHYDMQRCQERTTDQPLLEAAAAMLYEQLQAGRS